MRSMPLRLLFAVAVLIVAIAFAHAAAPTDVPNIAAASDLQFALEEITTAFRHDTGRDVKITFGSSGNFRRQIAEGAPFQMFLSADEDYVRALAKDGLTRDEGT